MDNFTILNLVAGPKQNGKDAGIKRVAEIHLADNGVEDEFYISLAVNGNDVCIYDTDNPTYHVQVEYGTELPCEDFDEIMQFCCTIETTRDVLMESPSSTWCNLYKFLLKAAESSDPKSLIRPYINHSIAELPHTK